MGAAAVAMPVSVPVLPHVPAIRADTLPVTHRALVLGHCLRFDGQYCGSWRPVVRARCPVHRGSLRRLADVSHHPTPPHRYAHGRTPLSERRVGPHRRRIQ